MAQISALRFKALIMQGRACHAHSPLHVSPAVRAAPAGRDVGCRACCTREGAVQLPCDDHARWACHPTTATNQRSAGSLAVPISSQVLRPPWVPSLNLATVTTLVPGGECLYMQILEVCRFQTGLSLCVYTRARTCVCSCACCWMWITRCSSVQTRKHRKELKPWTARRDRRRNLCAPGWQQATRHAPGLDTPVPIESVGHGAAHFACCQI